MRPVLARLEPLFVPRIWGARSLVPLFPEKTGLAETIGEVWMTGDDCLFATGPFTGRKLGDAWREMPADWKGTLAQSEKSIPLLVKFIFPEEKLSVQVHPDDAYAGAHAAAAGGRGKTEMWYAMAAREGAEVMVGMKRDVTPEAFRQAIAEGTAEGCLERVPLHPGDVVFVPAGTAHTIGPGLILCEIQQNSDITYRVFDYNRLTAKGKPRQLHIQQALDVMRFGRQIGGKVSPVCVARGPVTETYYVACRYFATEKWEFDCHVAGCTSPESFELLIILSGTGTLEAAAVSADYSAGQVWFLPSALGTYLLRAASPSAMLRTYVPDLMEFSRRLAERRVSEADLKRLVSQ